MTGNRSERERSEPETRPPKCGGEDVCILRLCRFELGVVRRSLLMRAAERDERTGASETTRAHTSPSALVVVGNCWPVFAQFRGGMGNASTGGWRLHPSPSSSAWASWSP
ncbi:MAG: glycerol-3-phosphate acyltransferase [Anaerolineales bacterium]|nr:glycerol-3-phosphate acyltransferase [Anaerolineales bacterium]